MKTGGRSVKRGVKCQRHFTALMEKELIEVSKCQSVNTYIRFFGKRRIEEREKIYIYDTFDTSLRPEEKKCQKAILTLVDTLTLLPSTGGAAR